MAEITYIEAIRQALWEEMERDERVFLIGEDIGVYGGAFKITLGFLEKFGQDRVIDTPICESAIVGSAVGAALMGLRPVVEMQFSDFIACAFDQIVNMAAKFHYRMGTSVPLVIRGPSGGGVHGGPFHSQNPEAWFVHVPGLKVLAPSSASTNFLSPKLITNSDCCNCPLLLRWPSRVEAKAAHFLSGDILSEMSLFSFPVPGNTTS